MNESISQTKPIMLKQPAIVIMAAGVGSRFGGLKQVAPIGPNDESLMEYSIYDALRAGFNKIIFVIQKENEESFRQRFGVNIEALADVYYAYQKLDSVPQKFALPLTRIKPWGTAHAVLCAKDYLTEPFGVINADDFYGADSFKTLYDFLFRLDNPLANTYCLIGYSLCNTLSPHGRVCRAVCELTNDGFLESIKELNAISRAGSSILSCNGTKEPILLSDSTIVSMNIWGFTLHLFSYLDGLFEEFLGKNVYSENAEFFLPEVISNLINNGKIKVKVFLTAEKWFGITFKEDVIDARKAIAELIKKDKYPEKLWS